MSEDREADRRQIERRIELPDAAATDALGRALAPHLRAGDCLALLGDVGAGKTSLVRGLAHGLAIDDPDAVSSPTYLLAIEHPGDPPLIHVDAYLPEKTRAFLLDGGVDYVLGEAEAVLAVEWADRIDDLLPARRRLVVELQHAGEGRIALLRGSRATFGWLEHAVLPGGPRGAPRAGLGDRENGGGNDEPRRG